MDIVDRLYNEYGEGASDEEGPNQNKIYSQGNSYLEKNFPKLSHIVTTKEWYIIYALSYIMKKQFIYIYIHIFPS